MREIEALYRLYNPGKLPEIPALVSKYGEARLLKMIENKYSQTATIMIPRAASGGFGLSISATGGVKKITAESTREAGVQLGAVIVGRTTYEVVNTLIQEFGLNLTPMD